MSVASEITRIQNAKASLKTSINAKTDQQHQITNETIDDYSDFVDSITTGGGGLDWSAIGYSEMPQSIQDGYNYALEVKNNWNASQTNLSNKFYQNYLLQYMPLVDTSNATNISSMFNTCTKLSYVPALTINASSITELFYNCYALSRIDTSNFNITNTTSLYRLFANCRGLVELDLSKWETSHITDMRQLFDGCYNLQKLDIRKFDFTKVSSSNAINMFRNVPTNCLIIVKSQTEKDRVLAIRSDFTNVKTVEEYNAMQ